MTTKDQPVDELRIEDTHKLIKVHGWGEVWVIQDIADYHKKLEAHIQAECNRAMAKFGIEKGVKYDVRKSDKVIVLTRSATPTNDKEDV